MVKAEMTTYHQLKQLFSDTRQKAQSFVAGVSAHQPGSPVNPKNQPLSVILSVPHSYLKTVLLAQQFRDQMSRVSENLWKRWFAMRSYLKQLARKYRAMAKKRRALHNHANLDNELDQDSYYLNALSSFEREFKSIWQSILDLNDKMKIYYKEMKSLDKTEKGMQQQYDRYATEIVTALKINMRSDLKTVEYPFEEQDIDYLMSSPPLHPVWQNTPDFTVCMESLGGELNPMVTRELNLLALMRAHPKYQMLFEQNSQKIELSPLLTQLRAHPLHALLYRRWEAHEKDMNRLNQTYQAKLLPLVERRAELRRACLGCQEEMLQLKARLCGLEQLMRPIQSKLAIASAMEPEELNKQLGLFTSRMSRI